MKAPGSANSATFLPAKRSSVFTGVGLPSFISIRVAEGILSPTLIVMEVSVGVEMDQPMFGCGCDVIMPCDVSPVPRPASSGGRKIIALAEFAAQDFSQELGVVLAFHPFHHHRALQVMRHGDNATTAPLRRRCRCRCRHGGPGSSCRS